VSLYSPEALLRRAQALGAAWVAWRRHLHTNPELSWQEKETAAFITRQLRDFGLNPITGKANGTGLWVDIGRGEPLIGWRADIDALPIKDCIDKPYVSQNDGVGHECGHDVHTVIALAVAQLLKENEAMLNGRVRVFFQPAEEVQPSGAPVLINDGVLEGMSAVYALHVDPMHDAGTWALADGPITAASHSFDAVFQAPAALHSARPHTGPNAMLAALDFAQKVQQLPFQKIDTRRASVIAVTNFHAGEAINVVPAKARVQGTIRTRYNGDVFVLREAAEKLAQSLSELSGVSVTISFMEGAPAVENHPALLDVVKSATFGFGSAFRFVSFQPSMGGEDFAYYGLKIPGFMLRLGTRSGSDTSHALHSNLFDVEESVIAPAAAFVAYLLAHHLKTAPAL
jgi:amidohydrolase